MRKRAASSHVIILLWFWMSVFWPPPPDGVFTLCCTSAYPDTAHLDHREGISAQRKQAFPPLSSTSRAGRPKVRRLNAEKWLTSVDRVACPRGRNTVSKSVNQATKYKSQLIISYSSNFSNWQQRFGLFSCFCVTPHFNGTIGPFESHKGRQIWSRRRTKRGAQMCSSGDVLDKLLFWSCSKAWRSAGSFTCQNFLLHRQTD